MGAQWISGWVPDSRPRGRGFEPHWRHCIVVLEQDTFILASTGSTQEDPTVFNWKIVDGTLKIKSNTNKHNIHAGTSDLMSTSMTFLKSVYFKQ